MAEVGQAPPHLGANVALGCERQDRVEEGLGDGPAAGAVGRDDPLVGLDGVVLEPRHQRRSHVERQSFVVVHDGDDAIVVVDDAGERVGPVALRRDPLVPVVERAGRRFPRDLLGPGVLARRLVEVAVDDELGVHAAPTVAGDVNRPRTARPRRAGAGPARPSGRGRATAPARPTPLPRCRRRSRRTRRRRCRAPPPTCRARAHPRGTPGAGPA